MTSPGEQDDVPARNADAPARNDDGPPHPDGAVVRVAAVGDIHLGPDCRGLLRPSFETLHHSADVLLLPGDLTRHGTVAEA
ncbi:metallophosphoesterase, partial [Streptomyces albidoflavus]